MKKIFLFLAAGLPVLAAAQLTTTPSGGNKKASVSEMVGLTNVTVQYSRPGVKGREGKVWGVLAHNGFTDLGFGTSKSSPWRAGANENTTIEFSTAVKIEGKDLPAGKYGLFIAYDPVSSIVIFSKNADAWGSYYYKESEDALRVNVTPVKQTQLTEWLKFEFMNQTESGATLALVWENLAIPFKIETDLVNIQLAIFRRELTGEKSFNPGWQSWDQAAQYCLQKNTNLEEALRWAETASGNNFPGEANFTTLSTKAGILKALNRNEEAEQAMKAALPMGKMTEIHGYARQLLNQKKINEAVEAFKLNYSKFPNQFTTNVGMARAHSALGEYKKALDFAKKALAQAPDPGNKGNVENMIKNLEAGKNIN